MAPAPDHAGKDENRSAEVVEWQTPGGNAVAVLDGLADAEGCCSRTAKGRPYAAFSVNYGNAARRLVAEPDGAGYRRFRAHDLRYRFAIRWLKAGGALYRLSRHLGHTSVRTTEIYLRHLTDDEMHAIRRVAFRGPNGGTIALEHEA